MMYSASTVASIIAPATSLLQPEAPIEHLLTDSRAVLFPATTLFFALSGPTKNGAQFLPHLYSIGVRNFVVVDLPVLPMDEAQFYVVPDVLAALQQLAAHHRAQFDIPVIGITGSNGKTIVKEWLYQMLQHDYSIVRSPKSYNSQVGVPLSIWQMASHHTLAIIEAGISQEGEMDRLNKIIRPTTGVLTNIGTAHDEGFTSGAHKRDEKLKLFKGAQRSIGEEVHIAHVLGGGAPFTWGRSSTCTLQVLRVQHDQNSTVITLSHGSWSGPFTIPFSDEASVENVITCICVLFSLGFDVEAISQRLSFLHAVDMRLQLKEGMNGCTIINDSYSADLTSLNIALHFLAQQHSGKERVVILSDFAESGKKDEILYTLISDALVKNKVQKVVAIGERIAEHLPKHLPPSIGVDLFQSTENFLQGRGASSFRDATILIKGARKAGFERIAQAFDKKVHQTVLQIDLNALAHNLKEYRKLIPAKTRVMAMVKAFGYGSGSAEIAAILQFNNVDYLGVAYADEGVALRKAGVEVPIMVLNTDEASFPALVNFNLQPVIYAQGILETFTAYLAEQGIALFPVHVEIETGMNRLGFLPSEIGALGEYLLANPALKVESVFSHLAASEDAMHDAFTERQAQIFRQAVAQLRAHISTSFLEHLSNSAAVIRHPHLAMDMVRLGIGLYGIEIATAQLDLQPVASLRSTIAQIKHLQKGDTVGYNRRGVVDDNSVIATVRIGYADGYARRLGHGAGKMWVAGRLAPVVGTVCMDMTMIDITGIAEVEVGDEVVIFGKELPLQQVAQWASTIPYEIMTSVSQRVARVYYQQ